MPETHAVYTDPRLTGEIPHGEGVLDVTPDWLFFSTAAEAQAAADSIQAELERKGL